MLSKAIRLAAVLLALVMLLASVGCSTTKTITTSSDVWVTEDGYEEDADGGDADKSGGDSQTQSGKTGSKKSGQTITTTGSGYTENITGNFDPYKGADKYKGKTVKVLFWFTPDANEQKIIDDFTKKTGIKVKIYSTENAKYGSKLSSMVASGNSPDVAAVFDSYYPSLITKGLFENIDKGVFDLKNDPAYNIPVMDMYSWKGNYYGVAFKNAWSTSHSLLYFNRTLFSNAGVTDPLTLFNQKNWNWDTLKDCAVKMTKNINGVSVYGLGNTMPSYLLASYGTDIVTVDNANGIITNNLKDPKVIKTFEYIADMRSSGCVAPESLNGTWSLFTNGQCAMWMTGQNWIENGGFFDDLKDDWSAVPIPSPKGEKQIYSVNAAIYGLPKGCKNPEMGSYFIRWHQDIGNWDISGRCNTPELYELYKNVFSNDVYCPMLGAYMFGSVFNNGICDASFGNVNDVTTVLATHSGSLDSAISSLVSSMK